MEEAKQNKEINAFVKKYVNEIKLESPSADFTSHIMDAISDIDLVKRTVVYKPLISKKGWLLVVSILAAVLIVPFRGIESKWITFPELNFSFLEKINFTGLLDGFDISNTVLYTACLFAVLLSVQIFYLKGHFEKQLSV